MDKKQCSKCKRWLGLNEFSKNKNLKGGLHLHCKDCKSKWYYENKERLLLRNKMWREAHKEYLRAYNTNRSLADTEKHNSRYEVHNALRRGDIEKEICVICGDVAEAHHEDYSKPLEIRWLCRKHHHRTENRRCYDSKKT